MTDKPVSVEGDPFSRVLRAMFPKPRVLEIKLLGREPSVLDRGGGAMWIRGLVLQKLSQPPLIIRR